MKIMYWSINSFDVKSSILEGSTKKNVGFNQNTTNMRTWLMKMIGDGDWINKFQDASQIQERVDPWNSHIWPIWYQTYGISWWFHVVISWWFPCHVDFPAPRLRAPKLRRRSQRVSDRRRKITTGFCGMKIMRSLTIYIILGKL